MQVGAILGWGHGIGNDGAPTGHRIPTGPTRSATPENSRANPLRRSRGSKATFLEVEAPPPASKLSTLRKIESTSEQQVSIDAETYTAMAKNRARSIERRYAAITRTLPEVAAARGLGGEVIA